MISKTKNSLEIIVVATVFVLALVFSMGLVSAQQSSSSNYEINEFFIGPGGLVDTSSSNYSARATLGETGVGNPSSTNFQAFGGYETTDEEFLEVNVTTSNVDLGTLDDTSTATGTAGFNVRNYLSSGYVVTSYGLLTSENGDTIPGMASQAAPTTGTEEFGFNLVSNTTPTTFGANPVQVPDASFSFGDAHNNYDDTNQYRYNEGDTIAESTQSTGQTDYTISYIANIAELTEAGLYQMVHDIIVISTF